MRRVLGLLILIFFVFGISIQSAHAWRDVYRHKKPKPKIEQVQEKPFENYEQCHNHCHEKYGDSGSKCKNLAHEEKKKCREANRKCHQDCWNEYKQTSEVPDKAIED